MFAKTLSLHAQKSLAILGKDHLPQGTYLAGGSALALHYGHRLSADFDFFTPYGFNQEKTTEDLKKIGNFELKTIKKDTLLGAFNRLKFSIFRYKYPLLFPTQGFLAVNIADARDIGAMKIAAVMDRGTKKDFVDLFFLSQHNVSIDYCLKYYDQKYGVLASNLYRIIVSLNYFDEAEKSEMPEMLIKTNWSDIKKYFEKEAIRLAGKYL